VFEGRVPQDFLAQLDSVARYSYVPMSEQNKMILIADGDVIESQLTRDGALPLGFYRDTETYFANKQFLLNCIEYLVYGDALLPTQHKQVKLRLLDPDLVSKYRTRWQRVNIVLPIAAVLLFGVLFSYTRRKMFAA
jgi:ABC-type uncharacterized transport system involved in gliding motility auxiliary subunit